MVRTPPVLEGFDLRQVQAQEKTVMLPDAAFERCLKLRGLGAQQAGGARE